MRKQTVILLLSLLTLTLSAQKDPEALQVLSDFSRKATSGTLGDNRFQAHNQ